MKGRIAVFIAAYSGTRMEWLDEAVASVRAQGVEPYVQFDEGVTHQRWGKAIEACATEYLHLAHHDDVYLPTFYEETVAYLDAHPECAAVFTLDYHINDKGHRIGHTDLPFPPQDSYDYRFVLNQMIRKGNFLRCPSVVFRVEKVKGLQYPECDSASDTAMWFEVLYKAGNIGIINKPLFLYRQSSTSDTQKNIVGSMRQFDHVLALQYGASLEKDSLDWDTHIYLANMVNQRTMMEGVHHVQKRISEAKAVKFVVVHEPPDNAGTGVVAAHRVREANDGEGEAITYYVYPDPENKIIREAYYRGCPCIIAHPTLFAQVVKRYKPERIEIHHTLQWGDEILAVETEACKELYLHDRWMWSGHPHASSTPRSVGIPEDIDVYANSPFLQAEGQEALGREVGLFDPFVPLPCTKRKFRKRVGFFGGFSTTKGVHILLQAARRMPDVLFVLFTTPPQEMMEGRQIHGHSNVVVMGAYSRADLYLLAGLVDVVAVPSMFESYGLIKRELESLGVKVIATKVGGMDGDIEPTVQALVEAIG